MVWHYFPQGFSVGISELAAFYVSISYFDILTGRVPHGRIHPHIGREHHCPVCDNPPEAYRIQGFGDLIGYILIAIPMIFTTLPVKASALFLGPVIYVGFAFRVRDYTELSLAARHRYRSSFKNVGLFFALAGIVMFGAKVFLYSYWSSLVTWWHQQPILAEFTPLVRPTAFLPFHLTGVCSSFLLLVTVYLVDFAIHSLEDRRISPSEIPNILRSVIVLTRIRIVLSIFTWICFIWLFLPWLRRIHFPPVSLELFPRS